MGIFQAFPILGVSYIWGQSENWSPLICGREVNLKKEGLWHLDCTYIRGRYLKEILLGAGKMAQRL